MVYLIGAGPGAADLLTLRALRALERSDHLICDRILGHDFIAQTGLAVDGKVVEWLGHGTQGPERQDLINDRLVALARAGKVVARVKNGDPLVFGRGTEEADALEAAGLRWEFVPGLSSSISTLTNAGYAITNRGRGRSFAVVSARLAGGSFNQALPQAESLVVLMGFKVLADLAQAMRDQGWAPTTPAVLIERGTGPYEKRIESDIDHIAADAATAGISSPVLLAVGTVAERRYASQQRPRILFTGRDPGPWRHLGDLLHWPTHQADGAAAVALQACPPAHAVLCVTSGAELEIWSAHHPISGELWTVGDDAATTAARLGLPIAVQLTATNQ